MSGSRFLEKAVDEVSLSLTKVRAEHADQFRDLERKIDDERRAREGGHAKTMELIDKLIAGYVGLAWVFGGTLLRGLATELAK